MKRYLFAVILAAFVSAAAFAQGTEPKFKNIKVSRDLKCNDASCSAYIELDYPIEGSEDFVYNVREWMWRFLDMEQPQLDSTLVKLYDCLDNRLKYLIRCDCHGYWESLVDGDYDVRVDDDGDVIRYCFYNFYDSLKVNTFCQTKNSITFMSDSYLYTGGTHGAGGAVCKTFRKSAGLDLSYEIYKCLDYSVIYPMIKEGLLEYFRKYYGIESWREVCNEVFFDNTDIYGQLEGYWNLWVENGTLVLFYGPYTLAPYCYGAPEARIPLSKILPYLSPELRQALE